MNSYQESYFVPFCEKTGFVHNDETGCLTGEAGGYSMIVLPPESDRRLAVRICVSREGKAATERGMNRIRDTYPQVSKAKVRGYTIDFILSVSPKAEKKADQLIRFIDFLPGFLNKYEYYNCCACCGIAQDTKPFLIGDALSLLCESCAETGDYQPGEQEVETVREGSSPLKGLIGAFIGSLLGVAGIVLVGRLGIVAAVGGFLMCFFVLYGYRKAGGSLDTRGVLISAGVMLVMIYVGHRFNLAASYAKEFHTGFFAGFAGVSELMKSGKLSDAYTRNLFMYYIFALIGAIPMVRNRAGERGSDGRSYFR